MTHIGEATGLDSLALGLIERFRVVMVDGEDGGYVGWCMGGRKPWREGRWP